MLIDFKITNFRSVKEEQTLSLVAGATGKDQTRSDSLVECDDFKLAKTAAIFGANASGKSNIVRAFRFMRSFVNRSATRMNLGDRIREAIPFRLDIESPGMPSSLELTLLLNGTQYVYGFSATADRVLGESLRVRPAGGRMATWFSRHVTPHGQNWKVNGPLRKDKALLREKTRDNGLALSRGAELNIKALSELFLWFRNDFWVYDLSVSPMVLAERTAVRVGEDASFRARVLQLLRDADLGISSIKVSEEPALVTPKDASEELRKVHNVLKDIAGDEVPKRHPVTTYHRVAGADRPVAFRLAEDESNGTQRFFALAGPILDALDRGQLLVLDEFECSMHPLLSRKLVELFQSASANKNGAQLIFATHDTSLMSQKLMRRDQIWFTDKTQAGATELFSLYDFTDRPRAASAFERNYFAGRFGAVPRFGRSLEDLEIGDR